MTPTTQEAEAAPVRRDAGGGFDTAKMGERIRKAMTMRGISGAKLARMMGQHPTTVNVWIRGQNGPNARGLHALCLALNLSADYLLGLDDTSRMVER